MSKSLGNVINPDDIIEEYGADSIRMYEMFMGPLADTKPWSTNGISGIYRFLDRVWRLTERPVVDAEPTPELLRLLHKTVKKVSTDTANLELNTAISQMMIFVNELSQQESLPRSLMEPFVVILAPFAPHLAEELWERLGRAPSVGAARWPSWDENLTVEGRATVVVQVNGKVRSKIEVATGTPSDQLQEMALEAHRIPSLIEGKQVVRIVTVPDKLVNIVVR